MAYKGNQRDRKNTNTGKSSSRQQHQHQQTSSAMNSMTCARKNKKRFSNEQVKSLEIIFQTDSRPESKTKQELAVELGLRPRQVAIWFQNRRARSRTKHVEREYSMLKTSYDTLASKFESLNKENQELNIQVYIFSFFPRVSRLLANFRSSSNKKRKTTFCLHFFFISVAGSEDSAGNSS